MKSGSCQVDEKRPTRRFECLTIHLSDMPTNRQSGLLPRRQPDAARSQGNYGGEVCPGLVDERDCRKPSTLDGCW